ncbi:MAG: enoyl-CoA hydratase/isomerase family protein [Oceanospirillaceae bacterium]|nr:enoyl-CoA hydratase/isomerase family protein [Oceanospirillaceae bacterium]
MVTQLSQGPLLVKAHTTHAGQQVVEVILNAPEALNALNGDMVDLLLVHVPVWEADENVIAIIMRGAGAKAFCAGGDIRQLYHEMAKGSQDVGEIFFNHEYEMDVMLHKLTTPFLVWGSGYVIGGGMGLLQGAALRLGTHSSRLAMPEVTIGLFPDVGASYFLRQVPDNLGLFMGLTGAMLNGTDARQLGLLDGLLHEGHFEHIMMSLADMPKQSSADTLSQLTLLVAELEAKASHEAPVSNLNPHRQSIMAALGQEDLAAIVASLVSLKGQDKWLDKALQTMVNGSPTSLHLFYYAFSQNFTNVVDALRHEYIVGVNAARLGEFQEGVRALLIDKDRNPSWRYDTVENTPKAWLDQFFVTENVAEAHF